MWDVIPGGWIGSGEYRAACWYVAEFYGCGLWACKEWELVRQVDDRVVD